jgi:hypothetical protein
MLMESQHTVSIEIRSKVGKTMDISPGLVNLMISCLASLVFVAALCLVVYRRSAWINSRILDASIYISFLITLLLASVVYLRINTLGV